MQLGMPTLIESGNIEECSRLCKELGLDFIELNMNLPQYQPERIDTAVFTQIAKEHGIYYTIHLDEKFDPCDFNRAVADAYMETAVKTIEIARELSAPVINLHMADGVYFTMPDRKIYLYEAYRSAYLERLSCFCGRALQAVGMADIRLCIENGGAFHSFQLEGLDDVLLKCPVFALTFDIGHSASRGGTDEAVIMERKNRLCHMHIHDAHGKSNHLPLGAGELDLPKYFDIANHYGCRAVLETKTADGLKQSVEWAKTKGYL